MIVTLLALALCGDAPFYADKKNLLVWLDSAGAHPVRNRGDWSRRRRHILDNMQAVMGPLPRLTRTPPEVRMLDETRLEGYTRRKITYLAEPGDPVPAYLLVPHERKGKLPAVVCLHQTVRIGKAEPVGLGRNENLRYAAELAARGYVALAPDYPNFGDYSIDVYSRGYQSATMKGIVNHIRAVDLLSAMPEVDARRIGAIGHSLGGHNTLFLGVFDERVRVLVTSCGFNSFFKYMRGDLTGWSHRGYMPRISSAYGKDPARMPFDFTEVLGALAPRPAFINAPAGDSNFEVSGVKDCVEAAMPVYRLFGAGERLVAVHPDAGHEFPRAVREEAYAFLDRWLKR